MERGFFVASLDQKAHSFQFSKPNVILFKLQMPGNLEEQFGSNMCESNCVRTGSYIHESNILSYLKVSFSSDYSKAMIFFSTATQQDVKFF